MIPFLTEVKHALNQSTGVFCWKEKNARENDRTFGSRIAK